MRVLAINDISCVGKCSLTAALPIISACGAECNVLPTALLSTHTGGFEGYTYLDLTKQISAICTHWESLGISFDFIYSGYLGSIQQIEQVLSIRERFLKQDGVFIVDPVMGDDGALYAGFSPEYVAKMRKLCQAADYILPNVTEACYLADLPYPLTDTSAAKAVRALQALCPHPIVTGIHADKKVLVSYINETGEPTAYASNDVPGFFCGAGDVFASAFTGALAAGKTADEAICLASDFAAACIRRSAKEVPDKRYGLNFEQEIFSLVKNLRG